MNGHLVQQLLRTQSLFILLENRSGMWLEINDLAPTDLEADSDPGISYYVTVRTFVGD